MDRPPPRGPRGGGGGGRRGGGGGGGAGGGGGGGGRDNERYGGRATDPNHSSRKRSRSRSPESRNYRENYRERDGRGEREYPKHDGGRGGDRGMSPITLVSDVRFPNTAHIQKIAVVGPHVGEAETTTHPRRGKDQLSRNEATETANTLAPAPETLKKAGEPVAAEATTSLADTVPNPVIVTPPTAVQAVPSPGNGMVNALMAHVAVRENAKPKNGPGEVEMWESPPAIRARKAAALFLPATTNPCSPPHQRRTLTWLARKLLK